MGILQDFSLIFLVIAIYFISNPNLGKGDHTVYKIYCQVNFDTGEYTSVENCDKENLFLTKTNYKPDGQRVISDGPLGLNRFNDCIVRDDENWKCDTGDGLNKYDLLMSEGHLINLDNNNKDSKQISHIHHTWRYWIGF